MYALVVDMKYNTNVLLPMEHTDQAAFGPQGDVAGYRLDQDKCHQIDSHLVYHQLLEERLLSCMYEMGQFCGVWTDTEDDDESPPRFGWAIVPESEDEVTHIEKVIVPYGRGISKARTD